MSSEHFDAVAATWDQDQGKVVRADEVARAVAAAVPLTRQTRLLEYGAGTGLVTQALAEQVGEVTLADSSAGMRGVLAEKIAAGALPADARVWDLDLETSPPPSDETFDLIVTSLVLHHVHDLDRVLRAFHALLAPGGTVCIADLDREDGSFHTYDFGGHAGFDRADVAARLSAAGLTAVVVQDCTELVKDGGTYSVFLAVGRRSD